MFTELLFLRFLTILRHHFVHTLDHMRGPHVPPSSSNNGGGGGCGGSRKCCYRRCKTMFSVSS